MAQVIWDIESKKSLKNQIDHIKKDSLQAAEKVLKDIFEIIDSLPSNPEKFPPDKLRINNNGDFRAFEKHGIRISYLVTENMIRILRVRHIKQEPKFY